MYYYLISALKRRLVLELKDVFTKHPVYEKIIPFIQNKFAFPERPQFGIVVKGSSTNKVSLAADNFVGMISSHVMLANVGTPTYPIEWIREDLPAIQANNNTMPIAPGIYYIEILSVPTNPQEAGQFMVDPLLTATDELVLRFQSGIEHEAQLPVPPMEGTLRLWENRRYLLVEGQDYSVNYTTGAITFKSRFYKDSVVTADYRYPVASLGPIDFYWNQSDQKTLPGVVMAFGKRARVGDKVAVMVYQDRVDTAQAYGGKTELSFDIDVIAQDSTQMEEIADFAMISLWGQKKAALEFEGIEILDVSISGEAEEMQDENAEIFFYTASMSVQLRADWEIHVPIPLTITMATPAPANVTTDSDRRTTAVSGLQPATSNLFFSTAGVTIADRNADYERIT